MRIKSKKDIEKEIFREATRLKRKYQGIDESVHYEGLAQKIISAYQKEKSADSRPRGKLGIKVLACFDDHGIVDITELEKGVNQHPDFVVFGGDHSPYTVKIIAEATMGIKKYALRGNHDGVYIEQAFHEVEAENIHGRIVETAEGLIIGGMHGSHQYREDRSGRTFLFQDESLQIAKTMVSELKKRSKGMDILFSHDKAFYRAYDPEGNYNDGCSHVGLVGNTWLLNFQNASSGIEPVQYFVHGHMHERDPKKAQKRWKDGRGLDCVYGVKILDL